MTFNSFPEGSSESLTIPLALEEDEVEVSNKTYLLNHPVQKKAGTSWSGRLH
jgi:hypothetical protein